MCVVFSALSCLRRGKFTISSETALLYSKIISSEFHIFVIAVHYSCQQEIFYSSAALFFLFHLNTVLTHFCFTILKFKTQIKHECKLVSNIYVRTNVIYISSVTALPAVFRSVSGPIHLQMQTLRSVLCWNVGFSFLCDTECALCPMILSPWPCISRCLIALRTQLRNNVRGLFKNFVPYVYKKFNLKILG
jgi:hypothetical protein